MKDKLVVAVVTRSLHGGRSIIHQIENRLTNEQSAHVSFTELTTRDPETQRERLGADLYVVAMTVVREHRDFYKRLCTGGAPVVTTANHCDDAVYAIHNMRRDAEAAQRPCTPGPGAWLTEAGPLDPSTLKTGHLALNTVGIEITGAQTMSTDNLTNIDHVTRVGGHILEDMTENRLLELVHRLRDKGAYYEDLPASAYVNYHTEQANLALEAVLAELDKRVPEQS